jgi:hypothetical protein
MRDKRTAPKEGTSPAKMAANRKNALRSTGPKTPAGKQAVRWNALKHGLLAKEVVIPAGEEDKDLFVALLAQLHQHLQPEGMLQEMLVERIAVCYWRLRRVLRCEVGEIRQGLDTARWQEFLRQRGHLAEIRAALPLDEATQQLEHTSPGLQYLIEILDMVTRDVQDEGYLCERAKQRLLKNFGGEEYGLAYWCLVIDHMATAGPALATQEPSIYEGLPTPAQCKVIILEMLQEERKKLGFLKEILSQNESLALEAQLGSFALPSREAVEKILRYETAIERQLYRAMAQLERLQRQRQGEPVPPPITGDLSSSK